MPLQGILVTGCVWLQAKYSKLDDLEIGQKNSIKICKNNKRYSYSVITIIRRKEFSLGDHAVGTLWVNLSQQNWLLLREMYKYRDQENVTEIT